MKDTQGKTKYQGPVKDYERGGMQKEIYSSSDVVSVSCPLCGANKSEELHRERGALGVVRCPDCDLLYVNPRLKEPDKVYWGDADKYFNEAKLIFEGKASHHRDKNYLDDLRLIHKFKPSGKFLDIGTNMGFFLKNALNWQWDLYGVEPSPSLAEIARKHFNLNVKTAFLENAGFESDFFDVVSMTDVFEHVPPGPMLGEIRRILKPEGILFIKVPNGLFNLLKLYFAKFTGRLSSYDIFDSYEHIVHYSDKSIRCMLKKHGFKVIKISIGKPIQLPVWHKYVGHFYQYPTPWRLDFKRQSARTILFFISKIEFILRMGRVGYFAPNIIVIAKKA